jgi:hypothetical protein
MEKFYLGVAREIITPEIGGQLYGYRPDVFSDSVEDDLTATAFYFKQGNTQGLMISLTVCLIRTELAQEILELIENEFSIPKENCMLNATHTHSGPNTAGEAGWGDIDREYCESIFTPKILSAVEKALSNTQIVKMGSSVGTSLVGINRREMNLNNDVFLGQNPWGCFNPKMTVISFINEKGEKVANIIHYGAHGTAAGGNFEVTRDWSGIMVDALESLSGVVTAFFNGPEGDVGPRISNQKTIGNLKYVRELGGVAAQDAVRIYKQIISHTDVDLAVSKKTLELPLKKRIEEDRAKAMLEEHEKANNNVNLSGLIGKHLRNVVSSYEKGLPDEELGRIEQTLIALGDIVFVSSPYEVFSEIGMRIDKEFNNKSVLMLSNTNGSEGYFVTQDALCRGGYEVLMFLYSHVQPFVDNADIHYIKKTVEHVKSIEKESEK